VCSTQVYKRINVLEKLKYITVTYGNIVIPSLHANEHGVLSFNYKGHINSYAVFTVYKITILGFIFPQMMDQRWNDNFG